ncbi:hypothetical protein [Marinimicrobium agarilyticum]|uniref:hypothetical protein n=1 Tax=Marinimicrobium agarilyticum TaxID=306546 RepID=UPI0004877E0F|nr:hypothetical protein [Marinimicrobium agarilyticum]
MKYIIAFAGLVVSLSAWADPITDISGTKELCQKAANAFGAGNPKESYEILKPYWPLPEEEISNLAYQTESQLKTVASRFGNILGSDFIGSQEAGDSFVQHTFIGKFEKHAVRFICVFYRPKSEWIVNAVYWDDSTQKLFQ